MYAVVLHASGRIDAERLGDMAGRAMMMVRAGLKPPLYAILEEHPSLTIAATRAAHMRALKRNQLADKEDTSRAVQWLVERRIKMLESQARDTRLIETPDQKDREFYEQEAQRMEAEADELKQWRTENTPKHDPAASGDHNVTA